MKRHLIRVLAAVMLLPMLATTAFASHGCGNGRHNWNKSSCADKKFCAENETCKEWCTYVDQNGDNICDTCENRCGSCGEAKDVNSDGFCDNCGKCSHFQDENDDGKCDHQAACEERRKTAEIPECSGHYGRKHRKHK